MTDDIVIKNGKALRCGYTTGTCATAAAAAAAEMLLTGEAVRQTMVRLPQGQEAVLPVENIKMAKMSVSCSVTKHAGDDPDVTDGMAIYAEVSFQDEPGVVLQGGKGVGTVTGPGLQVPPGEAAINPVPRRMIKEHVERVRMAHPCDRGLRVIISAENGEKIAQKTFNPRLGIVGGISILGTTGIVEPMSERALIETIHVLIDKARVKNSKRVVISPGNYGRDYCLSHFSFDMDHSIKFSNYVGETLDYLVYRGFEEVLLVGHAGKLVKLAAGVMNTHSAVADCRMEVLAVHSLLCGAKPELVPAVMACKTTDEALALLDTADITKPVMASVLAKASEHIGYRTHGELQVEIIMFATGDRVLAQTDGAEELAKKMRGLEE